jgi:hypothetical protein
VKASGGNQNKELSMHYDTGLRAYTSKRIEEIEHADILVGIPCYNNERTISHVIRMVIHGLYKHYKDLGSVIFVADGTTNAITNDLRICQFNLGAKTYDAKNPAESLGPMFRQVVHTLFILMEEHEDDWKEVKGSRPVPILGLEKFEDPEPIHIDLSRLITGYKAGFRHFESFYKGIFCPDCYEELKKCAVRAKTKFIMPVKTWVMVLYETAATFHAWTDNRPQLVNLVTPLYLGRVASFINQTKKMNSSQAEEVVEERAQVFEDQKDHLIRVWEEKIESRP